VDEQGDEPFPTLGPAGMAHRSDRV